MATSFDLEYKNFFLFLLFSVEILGLESVSAMVDIYILQIDKKIVYIKPHLSKK